MKLETALGFPHDYCPPTIAGSACLPSDLADMIIHWLDYRRNNSVQNKPPHMEVSDRGIRRLIDLAYFTSLRPEEGRYPSLRVVCQKDSNGYWRSIANFEPIILDGVDALRRLAPICAHVDRALFVEEKGGSLWCNGVMSIGALGYEEEPGTPAITSVGMPPPLRIELKGPGHLSVSAVEIGYELRAGNLRRLSPFFGDSGIARFFDRFNSYLEKELVRWGGYKSSHEAFGQHRVWSPLPAMICRMLQVALEAGHGGAFIVIPSDGTDAGAFDVKVKYRAKDLDLGVKMIRFWIHCAECHESAMSTRYVEAVRVWNTERSKLYSDAEALGDLSCIDGCVVLNQRLQLCGFGAEILVSDEKARKAPRDFECQWKGEKCDYDSFMNDIGGTRHKSVARLAKAHDGIIAFVLSQDSEIKLFSSSGQTVNTYGPLDLPFPEQQRHQRLLGGIQD